MIGCVGAIISGVVVASKIEANIKPNITKNIIFHFVIAILFGQLNVDFLFVVTLTTLFLQFLWLLLYLQKNQIGIALVLGKLG